MKVEIRYCASWNYKPNAASLAEELREAFGVEAELINDHSDRGIFDVIVDGKLVFSRKEIRRLPEPGEVVGKLKQ